MAYIVSAGEERFKIAVKRLKAASQDEIYKIEIDGKKKEVNIARISPTHLSILVDNQSYDVEVERFEDDYHVSLRSELFVFKVADERELIASAVHPDTSEVALTAPMPGLVVDVMVKKDEDVVKEDKLLILEAMKMQNEIRAPKQGKVAELLVKPGDSVNTGDRLIVIK